MKNKKKVFSIKSITRHMRSMEMGVLTKAAFVERLNTLAYKAYNESSIPTDIVLNKINRVEVIDENGRSYVNRKKGNKTELQVQDNGRTLKVFVKQGEGKENILPDPDFDEIHGDDWGDR